MLRCLALLLAACPAQAQPDGLRLFGTVESYTALRPADGAFLAARTSADLGLTFAFDRGQLYAETRNDFDALTEAPTFTLHEAYLDVFWDRLDLRLGRQVIVWGETDGTFVTDLLAPLDLSEFLAQPFEDLRLGVTAALATLYAGDFRLTGVAVPRRPTAALPAPGSPWYPLPEDILGVPVALTDPEEQDATLGTAEAALRLTWSGLPRTDLALLWIDGFNRLPAFRKSLRADFGGGFPGVALAVTPAYARRHVLGLTFETLALDPVVLRGEAAFHTAALLDERLPASLSELLDPALLDAARRGFLVEKPFGQAALAAERAFGSHLFRVQALGSLVFEHDARVARDRFEPAVTALWNGRFRRETLTARAFAFYNVGADYWAEGALTYAVRDALNATLGLQVFGGGEADALLPGLREPAATFATFARNDFVYLRVTYDF